MLEIKSMTTTTRRVHVKIPAAEAETVLADYARKYAALSPEFELKDLDVADFDNYLSDITVTFVSTED